MQSAVVILQTPSPYWREPLGPFEYRVMFLFDPDVLWQDENGNASDDPIVAIHACRRVFTTRITFYRRFQAELYANAVCERLERTTGIQPDGGIVQLHLNYEFVRG